EDHAEEARFLELIAVVHGPGNRQLPLELKQVGPRRYEARFPTWGVGRYQVTAGTESDAALAERGPTDPDEPIVFAERVHGGFALPCSLEYMRYRAEPIGIEQILEQGQGRRLSPSMDGTQIYEVDRTVRQSTASLAEVWWVWLILTLLVLH